MPSKLWLTAILDDEAFNTMEEVKSLTRLIMQLNNQIAETLLNQDFFIPLLGYHYSNSSNLFNSIERSSLLFFPIIFLAGAHVFNPIGKK